MTATVDVLAVQDAVALRVDDLALLVHHVVVLEHVLACSEVHRLDLVLGALDGLGDHARLDRHVVGHAACAPSGPGCGPSGLRRRGAQVVFEREVELRQTGVALAA